MPGHTILHQALDPGRTYDPFVPGRTGQGHHLICTCSTLKQNQESHCRRNPEDSRGDPRPGNSSVTNQKCQKAAGPIPPSVAQHRCKARGIRICPTRRPLRQVGGATRLKRQGFLYPYLGSPVVCSLPFCVHGSPLVSVALTSTGRWRRRKDAERSRTRHSGE